jgi:D-amino-acid dehydrogenase
VIKIAQSLRPLLADAPAMHAKIAAEAGCGNLVAANSGLMHVYLSRADYEADAFGWSVRRNVGIRWDVLEDAALAETQPDLHPRYRLGAFVGEAGYCRDPGAYVAALAKYARQRGAAVSKCTALGFRIEGERLKAVVTDQEEVHCDKAIIAAGIRSKQLAKAVGDAVPLEAERGYHAALEASPVTLTIPVMASDCRMVVTSVGGSLRAAGQVEIAAHDDKPDMRRAEILKRHLLGMFPGLQKSASTEMRFRTWMGSRPSLPDGMPCIGSASASRDVVHAFGHGHIGLVSSARTARVALQLVDGQSPEIPVGPFDPRRFGGLPF